MYCASFAKYTNFQYFFADVQTFNLKNPEKNCQAKNTLSDLNFYSLFSFHFFIEGPYKAMKSSVIFLTMFLVLSLSTKAIAKTTKDATTASPITNPITHPTTTEPPQTTVVPTTTETTVSPITNPITRRTTTEEPTTTEKPTTQGDLLRGIENCSRFF